MSESEEKATRSPAEIMAMVEALIFVADEPVTVKLLADVLAGNRGTASASRHKEDFRKLAVTSHMSRDHTVGGAAVSENCRTGAVSE